MYRPVRVAQFRAYRRLPVLAARWQHLPERVPQPAAGMLNIIREVFEKQFAHLNSLSEESVQKLNDLLAGRFTFLNHTLAIPQPDWNKRYEGHLWNYQFHYFGYLLPAVLRWLRDDDATAWQRCRQLIESWIEQARIGVSDGWDAYPISLRVVNWIYAYALVNGHETDQLFLQKWRASIYQQLDFLSHHPEYHLLANHLLENAKTLTIGGLFFADDEQGKGWLAQGEQLLWREFDEQVLSDGGHYERAPMYHALALTGFLECFALLRAFRTRRGLAWDDVSSTAIVRKLRAMTKFMQAMTYPDGTLARFNDSANTDETRPVPLSETALSVAGEDTRQQQPVFSETGYYCWFSRDGQERIIADAGPPSVDYNAGHAHCDLLSYELWLAGRPFIVDSGVHGYGGDRFRAYARSTRAHNTVMVNEQEQSEVWGTFRLARSANLLGVEVKSDEHRWDFQALYQPCYSRRLTHKRRILRTQSGEWIFEDFLQGVNDLHAISFIHLHPDVIAHQVSADSLAVECRLGDVTVLVEPYGVERVTIVKGAEAPVQGWYFPTFGIAQPAPVICYESLTRTDQSFGYRIRPIT